jgi:hypothetical protein
MDFPATAFRNTPCLISAAISRAPLCHRGAHRPACPSRCGRMVALFTGTYAIEMIARDIEMLFILKT